MYKIYAYNVEYHGTTKIQEYQTIGKLYVNTVPILAAWLCDKSGGHNVSWHLPLFLLSPGIIKES